MVITAIACIDHRSNWSITQKSFSTCQ